MTTVDSQPAARPRVIFSEMMMLVSAVGAMAISVASDHGHYSPRAVFWACLSAGLLAAAARMYLKKTPALSAVALEKLLGGALVVLLLVGLLDAPGVYLQGAIYARAYAVTQLGLALAVIAGFLLPRANGRLRYTIFGAGVALGFGLRLGMVFASPSPQIDVFTQFQESAEHLLHGLNPFQTPISEPPLGSSNFGYHVTGYAYPPANLYGQTLFYFLFGDIRYAHIAFELLAVGSLYAIVPKTQRAAGQLLVLLFLFHPRGFFVIEQAWNEPILVGCAGAFLWLAATRPDSRWVAVMLGLFLSLKQYLVFFAALFFLRPGRWRLLPLASVVVLLTWIPFLIWDASSAWENGLLFQFRTPFRPDGLTISSVFYQWIGWAPTKWVAISVGAVMTVATHRWLGGRALSGYVYASVLTTLAVFLCGSQAFCNYYYFLGAMLLFLIALRLREEDGHAR
jgi:hypothetical protein